MNITRLLLSSILICLLSACATPYQNMGESGGYYHQKKSTNLYKIGFKSNEYTDFDRTKTYSLFRAAEVGRKLGYRYMSIEGQADLSRTSVTNTGATSFSTKFGSETFFDSSSEKHPKVEFMVRYFKSNPKGPLLELFEIEPLLTKLRAKYKSDLPQ